MTKPGLIQRAGTRLWNITPAYAKLGEKSAIKPVTVHRATVIGSIGGTVASIATHTTGLDMPHAEFQALLLILLPASLILHSIIAYLIAGSDSSKTKSTPPTEPPAPDFWKDVSHCKDLSEEDFFALICHPKISDSQIKTAISTRGGELIARNVLRAERSLPPEVPAVIINEYGVNIETKTSYEYVETGETRGGYFFSCSDGNSWIPEEPVTRREAITETIRKPDAPKAWELLKMRPAAERAEIIRLVDKDIAGALLKSLIEERLP